ncbi:MAG: 16S rRNA (adenine(1518)-N(6)/adenine(1519)-N(6))-dimethyltransferase RsmA [Woeseia sp.]
MSRRHRPRRRFGQHFLVDRTTTARIVAAIKPESQETIVEIGPGRGAISEQLARRAGTFHAIELDRDLAAALERQFESRPNVSIHQADALTFDFSALGENLRIVGNLPYNISTPLLFHLIDYRAFIDDMHLMLQKEVVDRMAAVPCKKTYGRLTIMLGCYMAVEPLFDVPSSAFRPPPKVSSSVARLRPLPKDSYAITDHAALYDIVTKAFSQRRKKLRNALKSIATEDDLVAAGMDPRSRPEQIPIANYVALANHISRK